MIAVALAIAPTLRSISAVRMTKVRPTAMIAVTETCCRMFSRLPSVAKEGLARLKKTTRQSSVMNGATLRNWSPKEIAEDAKRGGQGSWYRRRACS